MQANSITDNLNKQQSERHDNIYTKESFAGALNFDLETFNKDIGKRERLYTFNANPSSSMFLY